MKPWWQDQLKITDKEMERLDAMDVIEAKLPEIQDVLFHRRLQLHMVWEGAFATFCGKALNPKIRFPVGDELCFSPQCKVCNRKLDELCDRVAKGLHPRM